MSWTPGPWAQDGGSGSTDPKVVNLHIAANRERDEDCQTVAWVSGENAYQNAALILLATEMADVILGFADCDRCPKSVVSTHLPRIDCDYCGGPLLDLAEKLSEIKEGKL